MNAAKTRPNIGADELRARLVRELAHRASRNPRYSLRRYARALGVSHALLSLVLSGKREPSPDFAQRAARLLKLDPTEVSRAFPPRAVKVGVRHRDPKKDDEFIRLSLDEYRVISDWQYFAILSLLDIRGARFQSKWIAARLGISESQALSAMNILKDQGLVEKTSRGRWQQSKKPIKVENAVSTEDTRKAHRQLLEKALDSLEHDPIQARDFSYCTFAMDEALIPYALTEIRKFRRGLMKKLERRGKANRVYELCVQLFPVSRGKSS